MQSTRTNRISGISPVGHPLEASSWAERTDRTGDNPLSYFVLLSFWAGYDAHSRMLNTTLSNVLRDDSLNKKVEMVSVSFDEYPSVARETVRMDRIVAPLCFAETKGAESELYKRYRLHRGFANYLLDDRGVVIAKNVTARELASYLN